jgi:hypothetical protein
MLFCERGRVGSRRIDVARSLNARGVATARRAAAARNAVHSRTELARALLIKA